MKRILLILLLSIPTLALGDQGTYLDKKGKYAGSWRGNDMHREYFGPDGSYKGSAERSGNGWTFKDSAGGFAGSSSGPSDRNPLGGNED